MTNDTKKGDIDEYILSVKTQMYNLADHAGRDFKKKIHSIVYSTDHGLPERK